MFIIVANFYYKYLRLFNNVLILHTFNDYYVSIRERSFTVNCG